MEEVTVSFSSLRLEDEVPILYFNAEIYLEKTKEIGEDGEILLWRLKIEEIMMFLLGDRYWRQRDEAYFRRGMKEEQTFENESYYAFRREVWVVFCSLEKREDFIAAIFRLSPHLPLVYPFFESVFSFVKYDYVEPFRCYKERGYDLSRLLYYQNEEMQGEPILIDVVKWNAKKVAQFYIEEGLVSLVELYTVAVRKCAVLMIEYLLPLLPPLPRGEMMVIKNEDGTDMAVLAHLLGHHFYLAHGMDKIKEVEFVKKILKRHGGINERENGKSPLFMAVHHRKDLIVSHLMNHGADVTKEDKIIGSLLVPSENNFNLIVFLIGNGAPITDKAKYDYYGLRGYSEGEKFKERIKKKFGNLFEDPVQEERNRRDGEMYYPRRRIRGEFEKTEDVSGKESKFGAFSGNGASDSNSVSDSNGASDSNSGGSLSSSFAGRGRGYQGKNYDPDYARKKRERERESDNATSNSIRGGGYRGRGGNRGRGRGGYRGYDSNYSSKRQKK